MTDKYLAVMYLLDGKGPLLGIVPKGAVPGIVVPYIGQLHDEEITLLSKWLNPATGEYEGRIKLLDWKDVPS